MRKFDSISLALKLPVLLIGLSVLIAVATAAISYLDFRRTLIEQTVDGMTTVNDQRAASVEAWFQRIEDDLVVTAASPQTATALAGFANGFAQLETPTADLHAAYITDNPNPAGSKHLLESATDGSPYSQRHWFFHPYFRSLMVRFGYDDVVLVDAAGNVVYTVHKDRDFATNLIDGPHAASGLAEAFRATRDLPTGETAFIDFAPYAPSNGDPAAFIAAPVDNETGERIGALIYQLPVDRLNALALDESGLGETGHTFLIGPDALSRSAARFDVVTGPLQPFSQVSRIEETMAAGEAQFLGVEGMDGGEVLSIGRTLDVMGQTWLVLTEEDMEEIVAPALGVRNKLIIQIIVSAVLIAVLSMAVSRTITVPLERVRLGIRKYADGEYDLHLRAADRGDEIGEIAQSLVDFGERLQKSDILEQERQDRQAEQARVVQHLTEALNALAQGDLTASIDDAFPEDYEALRRDFNLTLATLTTTIETVVANATEIRAGANEISQASDDLSLRTESQAATLEETAAALDELTQSVRSAADGAREVEGIVGAAKSLALESGAVVQSAVSAMNEIEKSASQISQIIGVIDDIAFQTNLLALNAGVEAARAGEAGRGFAVVASEVRALAQRSTEAAREINALISGSSRQVETGVARVGEAGTALTTIQERVSHISDLVTEIARGTVEQATGLGEINSGVVNLDRVTQQNAAMVEESSAAARKLNHQVSNLSEVVARFQLPQLPAARSGASSSWQAQAPAEASFGRVA